VEHVNEGPSEFSPAHSSVLPAAACHGHRASCMWDILDTITCKTWSSLGRLQMASARFSGRAYARSVTNGSI
jgi:hypothetical protein